MTVQDPTMRLSLVVHNVGRAFPESTNVLSQVRSTFSAAVWLLGKGRIDTFKGYRHLLSTLKMLESDRATLRGREARIAALEQQVEDYRRQLARVIERAVARNRTLVEHKPRPANRAKSQDRKSTRLN